MKHSCLWETAMSKSGVRRFDATSIPLPSKRFTPHFDQTPPQMAQNAHLPESDTLAEKIVAYMKANANQFPTIVINGVIHFSYVNFIHIFVYRAEVEKLKPTSPEIEAEFKPLIQKAKQELGFGLNTRAPTEKALLILRHLKLDLPQDKFTEVYHYTLKEMYKEAIQKLNTGSGINEQAVNAVREAYAACSLRTRAKL